MHSARFEHTIRVSEGALVRLDGHSRTCYKHSLATFLQSRYDHLDHGNRYIY